MSYPRAESFIVSAALERHGQLSGTRAEGGNAEEYEAARAALRRAEAELAEVEEMLGAKAPANSKQRLAVEAAEDALAALDLTDGLTVSWYIPTEAEVGEAVPGVYETTRSVFERLPVADKRRVLGSLIERAALTPGRAPVEERLTVTFKDGTVYAPAVEEAGAGSEPFGDVLARAS